MGKASAKSDGTIILIAVPTVREAKSFASFPVENIPEGSVSPCLVGEKELPILITGVGIPAAINSMALTLSKEDYPELIIHAGIAGSFSSDFPPGRAVIVEKDYFGDVGIVENNRLFTLAEKELADPNILPYSDGWIKIPNAREWAYKLQIPSVSAVTVAAAANPLLTAGNKRSEAMVETMEGAAVALFCCSRNIPLIHIRAVSNYVVNSDSRTWDFDFAFSNLRAVVHKLIDLVYYEK